MTRRRRIQITLLLLAVGGGVIHLANHEPAYNGRALSSWLRDLSRDDDIGEHGLAAEAIQRIGTNALPYILSELRRKDSPGKLKLMEWNDKLAARLDHELMKFQPAVERRSAARRAVGMLGSNAAPAIAEIARNLDDPELVTENAEALALIGRPALPAIKDLARSTNGITRLGCAHTLLLFTNAAEVAPTLQSLATDTQPKVRALAAFGLGKLVGAPQSNVPVLMQLLNDADTFVQAAACRGLGRFSNSAAIIIPALSNMLVTVSPNDFSLRNSASSSLRMIGPASLPTFLSLLSHPDGQLRAIAVRYLGSFPGAATNHVAELLPLLRDRDPRVRNSALIVFRRIQVDPAPFMPALVEAFNLETDENTRGHFLIALQQFGETATNALPTLIELAGSADADTRITLLITIAAIDEAAARKLGADAALLEIAQASRSHLRRSFWQTEETNRTNSARMTMPQTISVPPPSP